MLECRRISFNDVLQAKKLFEKCLFMFWKKFEKALQRLHFLNTGMTSFFSVMGVALVVVRKRAGTRGCERSSEEGEEIRLIKI